MIWEAEDVSVPLQNIDMIVNMVQQEHLGGFGSEEYQEIVHPGKLLLT